MTTHRKTTWLCGEIIAPGPKVNPFEDKPKVNFGFDEEDSGVRENEKDEVANKNGRDVKAAEVRRSALDELMKEEEKAKERSNRKDYWALAVSRDCGQGDE